jgi:hypothetical protein
MKTCFTIMPFEDRFADIDRIVVDAARECGLEYIRSDRRLQPGSVMAQVVRDIRSAAVVVADITGNNPNVFYELGIAHQLKGPERVVIITQDLDSSPYDVNEFNSSHTSTLRRVAVNFAALSRVTCGQPWRASIKRFGTSFEVDHRGRSGWFETFVDSPSRLVRKAFKASRFE